MEALDVKQQNEQIEKKEESETIEQNEEATTNKDKCVFISGIPYETTEDQLREIFAPCGVIRQIKLPKYQDTGRNIGYAHIYYKKNKGVKKLDKTYIGQRYLSVSLSNGEKKEKSDQMETPQGCTKVFVKNLPYDVTEEEVGNKFKPCGEINSIRFVYNTSHNHFKGFCYVEFADTEGVEKALKLNGKEIKGRNMIVDFEESGPRGGYKYRSETPSKFNKEYNDIKKKSLMKKRRRNDGN